jgi:hypothetical protein
VKTKLIELTTVGKLLLLGIDPFDRVVVVITAFGHFACTNPHCFIDIVSYTDSIRSDSQMPISLEP